MVSIQVSGEYVCAIERALAQHFSPVWRQRLANPEVKIVHVGFPNDALATCLGDDSSNVPSATLPETTLATIPGNAPGIHANIQAADPIEKNSVKFLVQWMQRGGVDPVGKNALRYPQNIAVALEKLHFLATSLGIDALITRTSRNLAAMKPAIKPLPAAVKPIICFLCRAPGHLQRTCIYCVYCRKYTHMRYDCPQLRAKAERDRKRQTNLGRWEEKKKAQEEGSGGRGSAKREAKAN